VKSDGAWGEGVPHNQSFRKLLVVAVTPDINQRCAFEEAMKQGLVSPTVSAATSCSVLGLKEPLTREAVERGVASFGADAVLATRLVDSSLQLKEGGGTDTRGSAQYKATGTGYAYPYAHAPGYWGPYGMPVVYGEFQTSPSVFEVQGTVRVTTQLYETRGATLVYTVDTRSAKLESRPQAMAAITSAIAERLHRDGLIR
jgi:hypothetical protein